MLELLEGNQFLDIKRNTKGDQPFSVDSSLSISAMPVFSSTLLDHSYTNLTNSNKQELLSEKNNRAIAHEDKKKDKMDTITIVNIKHYQVITLNHTRK